MLETNQSSRVFRGVHFSLFGFNPLTESQIRFKLVNGGGIDAGKNSESCTHVIVDKIVYDDPVCIDAIKDGKILVTSLWVEHSSDIGMPVDTTSVMYRPLKDLNGIPAAKDLVVCLTGYLRQDRDDIMTMVGLMGAQFSKPLVANKVTHLICYKFEGEKYELAKRLATIKLVNHRWLEDCLKNWVLLPEDKYSKSGFELELIEEEAKDSEDEAEDPNLGQSGGRIRSKSPLGSKFGTAVTPGLSKSLREEASNAIPDFTGPQVLPNVNKDKDSSTTTGNKNNSVQDTDLYNIGDLEISGQVPDVSWHSTSRQLPESHVKTIESKNAGFPEASGITGNTNSSGQRPNLHDDTLETKKLSYTRSTSGSADGLAHSDEKLGAMSYSRKNQKGFTFSKVLDKREIKEGNDLETSSTKAEKASEEIKSACVEGSGEETGVVQQDDRNNLLPQKRTNESASTKLKSRKITANAKLSIERTPLANGKPQGLKVPSVVDEPPVSDGYLSANKDGTNNLDTCLISKSAASPSNSLAFDKPVSRNAESAQCDNTSHNSAQKAVRSLSKAKIIGDPDITGFGIGQGDNEAEQLNVTTNLECSSPGKKSKNEGFAGFDNFDLSNEESNKLIRKSPRKKSVAKRTLGSRPRKGVTAKLKSSVCSNGTTQRDEGISSSSGCKVIATSGAKRHQASPQKLDVNKLEQKMVSENAEDAGGRTDFLDDETEAPDDKCEFELGIAPDKELVHHSKKVETSTEEKLEAVDHDKKCEEVMPPKKVANETEKQKQPSMIDSTSKLKVKHQAIKRPASKTKKTTAKKLAKSVEAVSMEKIPNETRDDAEIKILKEMHVASDISENPNAQRNKSENFIEEEKENRPNDGEHGLVEGSVENRTTKSGVKAANCKSKKIKHNTSISEFPARVKTEATCFILSGHRLQRKEFQQVIKRLKGRVCRDSHQWSYQATHFIAPDPIRRTEKFFAATASGRWILKTDFLTASTQAGKFLPEEPYEWHKIGLSEDGAINMEAPRKWRLLKERTGHGAFYGMRIVVYGDCFAPPLDTLKRVVKAGDGTILATSPPYTRFLDTGVDYAVVSPGMPRVDLWVQEFLKHEIPCVVADYLVEYVCKPGFPLERHVLYGTHAWADRSFAKLQSKAEEIIKPVLLFPPEDSNDDDDDNDDVSCQVCGSRERGDVMLICGDEKGSVGCGIGTHIDCCDPPLPAVPEEDWFCPKCSSTQKGSKNPNKRKKGAMSSSKAK